MTLTARALQSLARQFGFLARNRPLLVVCGATFALSVGMGLTNPIVSLYARSFGVSTSWVGIYITVFAVGRILVTYPSGRAADKWGRRKLLILGPFVIAAASIAEARADNFAMLTFYRMLHGVGSALSMSPAYLLVADLSAPEERGRSTSLFHTALLAGLTLGPLLGGMIAGRYGLPAPFLGTAAISTLVGVFVWKYVGSPNLETAGLPASQSETSEQSRVSSERSSPDRPWHDSDFLAVALVGFIIFVARAGARDTILPLRGNQDLGLSAQALGLMFTSLTAVNMLTVPVAGLISDRFGRKPAISAGLLVMAAAMFGLAIADSYTWFLVGAMLLGMGKGLAEPTAIVFMTDITPVGKYGSTYGLYLTLRDVGLLLGPVVLGRIADATDLQIPLLLTGAAMLVVVVVFVKLASESIKRLKPAIE